MVKCISITWTEFFAYRRRYFNVCSLSPVSRVSALMSYNIIEFVYIDCSADKNTFKF